MTTKKVTLDPGESREVAFTFTPTVAKVHVVSVDGLSGSFQALGRVELALSINLEPATESPSPGVIYAGGMMGIRAIATNVGAVLAAFDVNFYANNELIYTYLGKTLPLGYTRDYYYRYTVPAAGHYDIAVILDGFEAHASFEAIEAPVGVAHMYIPGPITDSWRVGDTVYIWGSAWVFNDGDGAGEYIEEWYIDDVLVGTNEGYLAPNAYDNNEKIWHNTELRLAPGEHRMHIVLKWNGHEDRYPTTGYSTFEVPL